MKLPPKKRVKIIQNPNRWRIPFTSIGIDFNITAIIVLAVLCLAIAWYNTAMLPGMLLGAALGALTAIAVLRRRLAVAGKPGIAPAPLDGYRAYDERRRLVSAFPPPKRLSPQTVKHQRTLYEQYLKQKETGLADDKIAVAIGVEPRTLSKIKQNRQLGLLD